MNEHLMQTYARLPVSFVRGEGVWLWDNHDNRYLDAISGIAVCGLGHVHPAVTAAIKDQAAQLIHTSNLYGIGNQSRLGDTLTEWAGMDRAFFCNSGAEANEAAIKIARLHGRTRAAELPTIVVMENSFHGRTLATLSATASRRVHAGFEPLVRGFVRTQYGTLENLETIAQTTPEVVAVLVEPIQGEGGVNIPPAGYLAELRQVCDRHGWLLMLDEIQTGMGRTGKPFAFQHTDIVPDVITVAKGLGNGVPIGACLARGAAADLMQPGNHGSTFGGNPLACAAGLAVIKTIIDDDLVAQAARMGELLLTGLKKQLDTVEGVVDIRGQGLILGIELDRPCGALVGMALDKGLLINVTADRVVRLLPPLIIANEQIEQLIEELGNLLKEFLQGK